MRHVLILPWLAVSLIIVGILPGLSKATSGNPVLILAPTTVDGGPISLSIQPYFGGHYKYGEWLPVRAIVRNDGPDVEAELQAIPPGESVTIYAVPAPLPAGARKEFTLYVLLPSFARTLTVKLVAGGKELAQARVSVTGLQNISYVVGVIAPDATPFGLLKGLELDDGRREVIVVPLSLSDLPDQAQALRTFDALILVDTDTTSLSPAQVQALMDWIESGGRLVLAGGPGVDRTLAGLPDDIRPEIMRREVLDGTHALATFAGPQVVGIPGEFVAALPRRGWGRVLVEHDARPLVCERRLGGGWITYLAFDPAMSPFREWAGMRAVWSALLAPGAAYPENRPPDISEAQMAAQRLAYTLTNLPSLDLPSVRWLGLWLAIYILVVGPANYLLLRRARRLDWAWLTIPGITLVFAGGAFGLGYQLRGSDLLINQISIVRKMYPDAPVLVRSYVGIFSPARRTYDVVIDGQALASPLISETQRWGGPFRPTRMTFVQGDPERVRGIQIDQWAMQGFQVERYDPPDRWEITADLSYEESSVTGEVSNGTPYDLTDAVVVVGQRYARLGDIPAGGKVSVNAKLRGDELARPPFPYVLFEEMRRGASPREMRVISLKQNLLGSIFDPGPERPGFPAAILLIGWAEESPIGVSIPNAPAAHLHTTLVLAAVPLPLDAGKVILPPGTIPARLVRFQGEAGWCGPGRVFIGPTGEAEMEYQLPPELMDANIEEITLAIATAVDASAGLPKAALYDWSSDEWIELEDLQRGVNTIQPADRFVHRDGAIRLRLSGEGFRGGDCLWYGVGVKAVREP
ncbi:MAG TPA: DUF4350 domain-containing protein [Caldilineae bacterium]|nr:DUF4350 domain-containing protein [Caldilineae bacterium]